MKKIDLSESLVEGLRKSTPDEQPDADRRLMLVGFGGGFRLLTLNIVQWLMWMRRQSAWLGTRARPHRLCRRAQHHTIKC